MKLDDIKKLHQKKYRTQFGHFLVEGEHLILELQRAAKSQPQLGASELLVTEQYADWHSDFKTTVISERQMTQISDTKSPQGIIAVVPLLTPSDDDAHLSKAVYLHEIQDPGNLGTIIRTLGWFGGLRLLLSSNSVDPYNPKVVRASMGAIFHVAIEQEVELDTLPHRYKNIACLDMQGEALSHPSFHACECYVFGNEARGIPRDQLEELSPHPFTIKGCGDIESLNLATAVNMCVYEMNR
ncbi:TrmH family RNA methyltransferase [Thalassolituus oleivorans]|jgi:TrmH family RNA methyltransferase|uniref:TrmH family RNA methyltransferase n=1 Tax=Thalassolituus oleivorans TaxID=187493 RepID=UPI00042DCC7C|nr:RNA methyltransferase [Thalassolituus oleivorans]AHK16741.1 rRNA methyltransferase [Thalassolituus oleivorans R6-15]